MPTCNNQASQPASTGSIHLTKAARKIEARYTIVPADAFRSLFNG